MDIDHKKMIPAAIAAAGILYGTEAYAGKPTVEGTPIAVEQGKAAKLSTGNAEYDAIRKFARDSIPKIQKLIKKKECAEAKDKAEEALDRFEVEGSSVAFPGLYKEVSKLYKDADKCRDKQINKMLDAMRWGFGLGAMLANVEDVNVPMGVVSGSLDLNPDYTIEGAIGYGKGSKRVKDVKRTTSRGSVFDGCTDKNVSAGILSILLFRNFGSPERLSLGGGAYGGWYNSDETVYEGFNGRQNPGSETNKKSGAMGGVLAGAKYTLRTNNRFSNGLEAQVLGGYGSNGPMVYGGFSKRFNLLYLDTYKKEVKAPQKKPQKKEAKK